MVTHMISITGTYKNPQLFTCMTHMYANIGDQVKIFYTIKNYQQSLVGLTTAITPEEKTAVVMLTDKVIRTHTYFETIWCLLELIASAKRCHPLRKDNKI